MCQTQISHQERYTVDLFPEIEVRLDEEYQDNNPNPQETYLPAVRQINSQSN